MEVRSHPFGCRAEPVVLPSSGPITDTLILLEEAVFAAAGVLRVGVLLQVQCVYAARLWDVDQPGMLLPQDAIVPQPGHPDRHQDQSCRETTNRQLGLMWINRASHHDEAF